MRYHRVSSTCADGAFLLTTLNAYIAQDITFRSFLATGGVAVFNPTEDDYWPLPQDQIDLQKGVLVQDPAY